MGLSSGPQRRGDTIRTDDAMTAHIIDGKTIAGEWRARVAATVQRWQADGHAVPGLAVVLVGEDPASKVYVASKARQTVECGMASFEHRLPATTTQADLLSLIARLNADPAVNGILVQLPLPRHISEAAVLLAIDPAKDVDGFHPVNAGRLATGKPGLVPCTPLGCLHLARSIHPRLDGLEAVVIGRSNIVGKPVANLLLIENCTVTIAHSRTRDLPAVCRRADVLIAAVGRPLMVGADWIKPGATVIDVGINRIDADGRSRLVGDVDFEAVKSVAGAITPVPGGVGPMTIAMLLVNTLTAAADQWGIAAPDWT
jgi:methylenetetrahydrofolate dehydrogenase (NADP+)/methenyltetrahydrofolate cyclohydrolase